jgi:hypothetical protein
MAVSSGTGCLMDGYDWPLIDEYFAEIVQLR